MKKLKTTILAGVLAIAMGALTLPAPLALAGPTGGSYGMCREYGKVFEVIRDGTEIWRRGSVWATIDAGTRVRVYGCNPDGDLNIVVLGRGNLRGPVNRDSLRLVQQTPAQEANTTAANDNIQEIITTGRWGPDVPVFRDQRSFFNARDRGKIENVVCRLRKGMHVVFKPYRDWGLGEVQRDDCKGWIDRGVIR